MNIVIVGPGYVGHAMATFWAKEHLVTTVSRETFPQIKEILKDKDILVLCMAARSKDEYENTYLNSAKAIKEAHPQLKQIIYTSSTSVYSEIEGNWVTEESSTPPSILLKTEEVLQEIPTNVCCLRLGGIWGPGRYPKASDFNSIHLRDIERVIDFALKNNLSGVYNACLPSKIGKKRVSNEKIKALGFEFLHPLYSPPMEVAFSPCPNDTFIFHAWMDGHVGTDIPMRPILEDVQTLNEEAKRATYPVSKVSIFTMGKILDEYQMLPVGVALGFGVGPKIVAKCHYTLDDLPRLRIAVPGSDTTAHLLLQLLLPEPAEKIFCTYDQIFTLIDEGKADCGLIIHEQRFIFQKEGFVEMADLGALWEEETKLPLPLGCIAAKRSLGKECINKISRAIKESLIFAKNHPDASLPFIQQYAGVKDATVVHQHIETYVTDETLELSSKGLLAIETLLSKASVKKLIRSIKEKLLQS